LSGQEAHIVQLYSDDHSLLDALCRFIGDTLALGASSIVIATKARQEGLAARLNAQGLDTAKAVSQGRYYPVDAEELLPRLMVDGQVDEPRFTKTIGDLLTRAREGSACKDSPITVLGELVALLWAAGKPEEALRAEQLWNRLARNHHFLLLCPYPVAGFDQEGQIELFLKMCAQHSGVVPNQGYLGPTALEERLRTIADLQQKTQALERAFRLRQSEERFRLLVEAVQDYAIFMLDATGHVVSWNAGAQRIKGYLASEIIGKHFSCFYPPEDLKNGKPEWGLQLAVKQGRFADEGWRIRKDGSRFWASVVITALRDDAGELIGFGKVTRDFTERLQAQEALQQEIAERTQAERKLFESEESLRQLSRHLLRSQDEERRRIGRELHDSLGQSLAAMKINLDSLAAMVDSNDLAAEKIAECIELAESSIKEVRTISYLLHPPMLEEMGLKSAILWYLDGFSTRSGIKTTFDVRLDFGRLGRDVELALFRVLQESLTNIHRHSGSETAHVRLSMEKGTAILDIKDCGTGMAAGCLEQTGRDSMAPPGVGLRGMKERMLQLGGKLELISTEEGTTVRAEIPIKECFPAQTRSASPLVA
jgi:PAS domain S-box-containing protein